MEQKSRKSRIVKVVEDEVTVYFDKERLVITAPVEHAKRNCKKVILPADDGIELNRDYGLIKALVRAFKWREMLESGKVQSAREIACNEGIGSNSYVSRHIRMTSLSPKIIRGILNGTQPKTVTLSKLLDGFTYIWEEQEELFKI